MSMPLGYLWPGGLQLPSIHVWLAGITLLIGSELGDYISSMTHACAVSRGVVPYHAGRLEGHVDGVGVPLPTQQLVGMELDSIGHRPVLGKGPAVDQVWQDSSRHTKFTACQHVTRVHT